ncbi:uncharacterized protein [Clytia hemisphaerica]|uniref:SMODS and SLOG-associating 2TM effector domain-containing protein n=1 Tax=Clytia hemisphaerica TaxID=252671 RepID=A0A7M6DQX9_9CNID
MTSVIDNLRNYTSIATEKQKSHLEAAQFWNRLHNVANITLIALTALATILGVMEETIIPVHVVPIVTGIATMISSMVGVFKPFQKQREQLESSKRFKLLMLKLVACESIDDYKEVRAELQEALLDEPFTKAMKKVRKENKDQQREKEKLWALSNQLKMAVLKDAKTYEEFKKDYVTSSSFESSIKTGEVAEVNQEPDTVDGNALTGWIDKIELPIRTISKRRQKTIRQSISALKRRSIGEIDTKIADDQERRFSIASGEHAFGEWNNNGTVVVDQKKSHNNVSPLYYVGEDANILNVEDVDRPLSFTVNMKKNYNLEQPHVSNGNEPKLYKSMQPLAPTNHHQTQLKVRHSPPHSNPQPKLIVNTEPEPTTQSHSQSPSLSTESINLTHHRQDNKSLTQETHFASSNDDSDQEIQKLGEVAGQEHTVIEIANGEDKESSKLIQS